MRRLVIASGNPGKLAEFRELLRERQLQLTAQNELGIADPPETGSTFVENALIKARNASRQSGLPALADDSGLLVDALNGAPGLISAHYAGIHGDAAANIRRLLSELTQVAAADRSARFHCTIVVLRHADDPAPLIAQGQWHGTILDAPRGSGGFGYDPVFFDPESNCSAAELDPAIKNLRSHRARALATLSAQWDHW